MHYQWGRKDPFTPAITANQSGYGTEVQIYNANGTAITKGTYGIATTEKLSEFKYETRTTTNQTTINHLIQNPSTHYNLGNGTNIVPIASTEYYNTTEEGDWWNPTIKTIYDPCPNGYRIPKYGTYGEVNSKNPSEIGWDWSGNKLSSGYTWKSSFFPANGQRNIYGGTILNISAGYYWMSTLRNSLTGSNLRFYNTTTWPSSDYERSHGFTTRCIKE